MEATGFQLAAADLNGDGKTDLVRPTSTDHRNTLTILLGDGSGRVAAAPGSPLVVPGRIGWEDVAIADFNRDGKPDLAGGDRESKQISILLGDGAGRFHAATTVPVESGPHSIVAARFDGDSDPDLAVLAGGTVTVLIGDGKGGFCAAPGSPVAVGPAAAIASADYNGDGRLDLAVASEEASGFSSARAQAASARPSIRPSTSRRTPSSLPTSTATAGPTSWQGRREMSRSCGRPSPRRPSCAAAIFGASRTRCSRPTG
jgi:hypothetical protein